MLVTEETISQLANDQKACFGKVSKKRELEPSMFDLLKWPDQEKEGWCFKKNPSVLENADPATLYKNRINHSSNPFCTESRDNFRPFQKEKNTKVLVPEIDQTVVSTIKDQKLSEKKKGKKVTILADDTRDPASIYQENDTNTINTSVYRNNHSLKKIKDYDTLYEQIEKNKSINLSQERKKSREKSIKQKNNKSLYLEEEKNNEELENFEDAEHQQGHALDKSKKTKKVKDPVLQKEKVKRREERIKKFKEGSRFLPNSSFLTYYGKPPFSNYGMNNSKPAGGGCLYGEYLMTHNVCPHKGERHPQFQQTYTNALKNAKKTEPKLPRKPLEDYTNQEKRNEGQKLRNQLLPPTNKVNNFDVKKPDLVKSHRFASRSPSSRASSEDSVEKHDQQQENHHQKNQKPKKVVIKEQPQEEEDNQPPERKFIDELKEKKMKAQRLALKVTEVQPSPSKRGVQGQAMEEQQKEINKQLGRNQDLHKFDDMNPPEHYITQLEQQELDPKNYRNVPQTWLKRIPFAGKKVEKSESIKNIIGN